MGRGGRAVVPPSDGGRPPPRLRGGRALTPDTVLLGIGYAVGTCGALSILRIAWRRWLWALGVLELGVACIVAGFALRGQRFPAWMNAGWGVGFLVTYAQVGRIRRRREAGG